MTRTKRFLRAMTLASFLLGAGAASAAEPNGMDRSGPPPAMDQQQGDWHGMHHGGEDGMGMPGHALLPLHGLKLSDAQQDKVFQLVYAAEPALYQKMKALRATREGLRSAAGFSAYDPAKVKQLAEQQGRQMADLISFRSELRHKIYGVLTPEQQQQLKKREVGHEHRMG